MSRKAITVLILLVVTAVLAVWDIYVAADGIPGDTISEIILGMARRHPIIPFLLGVICGHLFWWQTPPTVSP